MSNTLFGGLFSGTPEPAAPTSSTVTNSSAVPGASVTDALNALYRVQYTSDNTAAAYVAVAGDLNKTIPCDRATAQTVQLTTGLAPTLGDTITLIQVGAGQAEFTAGGGVTLLNGATYTNKTLEQYTAITAQYRGSNTWLITGDRDPV